MKLPALPGPFNAPVPKALVLFVLPALVLCCCGVGVVGALIGPSDQPPSPTTTASITTPGAPSTSAPAPSMPANSTPATVPSPTRSAAPQTPSPPPKPRTSTATPSSPIPRKTTSNPKPSCDPNYSGGCVPIASDVDCGGGSGNGPAYFWGTAKVVGIDIYDLDRDGDGIACDN